MFVYADDGARSPKRRMPKQSLLESLSGFAVRWGRTQERFEKTTFSLLGTLLLLQSLMFTLDRESAWLEMPVRLLHYPTAIAVALKTLHWSLMKWIDRRRLNSLSGD